MQILKSYAAAVVDCYNSIVTSLEFERQKLQADDTKIVEGYSTALSLLSIIYELKLINYSELCLKTERLYLCIDCPLTHIVPLAELLT